ncbi:MAG: DNA-directed RNA polymerase subunit L [Halobacteriota archaeon]|nr:DNA-directed RNA polymerase subunit L [Halobacteriota archaeon]
MDIKILETGKDEIRLELASENHTFLNALKSVLLQDDRVIIATYNIKYPTATPPIFYLRTKDADPIVVLKNAASLLISQCDEFKRIFSEKTEMQ